MSTGLRLLWNRFWESEEHRIDRQRVLLDLLWHTPIPTDEAVAMIEQSPTSVVRQRDDENDNFPIHVACSNGAELPVLQALVKAWKGGCTHVTARDFETPLHLACLRNLSPESIACLGDAYPRAMRMPNRQNDLPIHLACQQHPQKLQVIQYLVDGYPQCLIKKGKRGYLPLHVALSHRASLAVVQALTTAETATLQNREGETALHIAVSNDVSLDVILHLLEAAPTNEALLLTNTRFHDTPLHVACRTRGRNLATIQVLAQGNRQALMARNKNEKYVLATILRCVRDEKMWIFGSRS